jgi:hypothetical protein
MSITLDVQALREIDNSLPLELGVAEVDPLAAATNEVTGDVLLSGVDHGAGLVRVSSLAEGLEDRLAMLVILVTVRTSGIVSNEAAVSSLLGHLNGL